MNNDGTQTIYLYIDSSQVTDISGMVTPNAGKPGQTPGNFRYRLPNAIPNVVSADIVSCNMYYENTSAPPPSISICSAALGATSIVSYGGQLEQSNPLSIGMRRAWRVLLNANRPENPLAGKGFAHFENPRIEYTPIGQSLLQDIDIQIIDYLGFPLERIYYHRPIVYILIALRVARPTSA
jgi:hypothetical protein